MCTYPVQPVCTSLPSLLFILLFIKSHILFLHILLVLHFSLFYCTFYSLFLFFTYILYMLLCCYFYIIFIILHCLLSGPDLIYISLLIIPCIIYYVTNKETLNLGSIKTSMPMELVCLDFWTAEDGKKRSVDVLVVTDHFTKLAHAFPCANQSAKQVARKLWDRVFCVYGFPSCIHTDQGANFETTGYAPFQLMFGRVPRMPVDIMFRQVLHDPVVVDHSTYLKSLMSYLHEAVRGKCLNIGDCVLVANKGERGKSKLADKWDPVVYSVVTGT